MSFDFDGVEENIIKRFFKNDFKISPNLQVIMDAVSKASLISYYDQGLYLLRNCREIQI